MIEILQLDKKHAADESALRAAVAAERPGSLVEGVKLDGDNWLVRVKTAEGGDLPPFMKKEEEGAPKDEAPKDDEAEDKPSGDEAPKDGDKPKGEGLEDLNGDGKSGDLVGELKSVIEQATKIFEELGGKAEELAADAEEKDKKIQDIHDSIKGDVPGAGPEGLEDAPLPGDIGPTPGKPAGPGAGAPPAPPKRPGVPSGKAPGRGGVPGGGIPTFTHRATEVVRHPGVNPQGERISLVAASAELEKDEAFAAYYVAGMTENADGTYSAKLKLRD